MEIEGDKYFVLLYLLLLLVVLAIPAVLADGAFDDLNTTVTVGNSAPTVGTITCNASDYTPIAESSFFFNCTATVSDNNGYEDLTAIRGEFYNDTLGYADNKTKHYNNDTCIFISNASATERTVECRFEVYYFANPADWTIYFNVTDEAGDTGINTSTITINQLIALNVTNTTIPFGNVNLDQLSDQITTTIKITGNVDLDLKINESQYNSNMTCDGTGSANINTNATSTGVRYNTTDSFNFSETTWKLSSGNDLLDLNWSKSYYETSSTTPPQYNLYWKIKIPATGVSGNCSTVTKITAQQST